MGWLRRLLLSGAALFAASVAAPTMAQDASPLAVAFAHLKAGEYAQARDIVDPLAEAGDADAQHMLGYMKERGLGVAQDLAGAIELYVAAANAGSGDAQFALGELALLGAGVKKDAERAADWLKLSAAQGHVQAMIRLGMIYAEGAGPLEQNMGEAFRYFRQAAELGDVAAQYNIGVSYLLGQGTVKNYDKSAKWFEKAAEQGHGDAQYNLALLYDSDFLGAPDPKKTLKWMQRAVANELPAAYIAMGLMAHDHRFDGVEGAPAVGSAPDWFEKAANAGDPQGQFLFAVALANGDGRPADPQRAISLIDQALAQPHSLAPQTLQNAKQLRAALASGGPVPAQLRP